MKDRIVTLVIPVFLVLMHACSSADDDEALLLSLPSEYVNLHGANRITTTADAICESLDTAGVLREIDPSGAAFLLVSAAEPLRTRGQSDISLSGDALRLACQRCPAVYATFTGRASEAAASPTPTATSDVTDVEQARPTVAAATSTPVPAETLAEVLEDSFPMVGEYESAGVAVTPCGWTRARHGS